jgi:glutamate synthase (NADPH/NADH) small chain
MVYRRSEGDLNAYDFEVQHAREKGVKFLFLSSPVEIIGKERVEGIKFIKNTIERNKSNTNSKPEIKSVSGTEYTINCDRVIIATGQEKQTDFLKGIQNLKLETGKIIVNKDFQTSNPKYFAGGDCINGGKEVVNAAADGRDAARGIHKFLMKGRM